MTSKRDLTRREVGPTESNEVGARFASSRFNALRHGVLSKHVLLPHENGKELSELVAALVSEHRPQGPTEAYLVEELAACIWRKRRVLMAERTAIWEGIGYAAANSHGSVRSDSPDEGIKAMMNFLAETPAQIRARLSAIRRLVEQLTVAAQLLVDNEPDVYARALAELPQSSRNVWEDLLEDGAAVPTADGLREYILEGQLPSWQRRLMDMQHHREHQLLAIGAGIQADRLEPLARYEMHLDRKIDRVLSTLIRLQTLRLTQSVSQTVNAEDTDDEH